MPEVLLGLLDRFDIINMLPPADATVLLTTSEAESAPLPESPTAFAGYAWFIISALAGVKGVADKIGEKRVDQAAALLECSIAPPEWPPSGVDTAATVDTSPPSQRADPRRVLRVPRVLNSRPRRLLLRSVLATGNLLVLGAFAVSAGLPVPDWLPLVPGWPPTEADLAPMYEDSATTSSTCRCASARARARTLARTRPMLSRCSQTCYIRLLNFDSRPVRRRC